MNFHAAIEELGQGIAQLKIEKGDTLVAQAARLIGLSGSFPLSPEMLRKLRLLKGGEGSTIDDMVALLSRDPALCIRLLALCNQSFYSRGQAISRLDQAVNHLGLLKVADIAEELSKTEPFREMFRGRAVACSAYQNMLLAGIVSRRFFPLMFNGPQKSSADRDSAFLMGSFGGLWSPLFAYTRPHHYSACILDVLVDRSHTYERNVRKIFGKSLSEMGALVLESIGLPAELVKLTGMFAIPPWNRRSWEVRSTDLVRAYVASAYTGGRVAFEISSFHGTQSLDRMLRDISAKCHVTKDALQESLAGLRQEFVELLELQGLPAFRLPEYLSNFDDQILDENGISPKEQGDLWPQVAQRIEPFLTELKVCFKTAPSQKQDHRLPQAIYSTLLALVRGLNFDRAVFFEYSEEENMLVPKILFGRPVESFQSHGRYISGSGQEFMPDIQAFLQKRPSFQGDPVFSDDWPFVAFPTICDDRVMGVFYADKKEDGTSTGLSTEEQVATIALAEEWHKVPTDFH